MLSFKDAKECSSSSSLHETASTAIGAAAITASGSSSGKHNINDSSSSGLNIEEVEKASSNDGNNDGMSSDEVVVSEAKRRRKSPPVQIRQKADPSQMPDEGGIFSPQRPPSSSMSEPSCEEPQPKRLSLKSPLDLEARSDRGAMSSPSPRPKQSESEMANSIQAALTALQAGQVSLNQVHDVCHLSVIPTLFTTTYKANEVCNFTEIKDQRTLKN